MPQDERPARLGKPKRGTYACDFCSTRRIRCNSNITPSNVCDNCSSRGLTCAHSHVLKKVPDAKGYVSSLEARLQYLEALLQKLQPGLSLDDINGTNTHRLAPICRNDEDLTEMYLSALEHNSMPTKEFIDKQSGAYLIHTALQLQDGDNLERAVDAPECLTSRPNLLLWEKYMESQRQLQDTSSYDFPQLDLISSLVDLYFTHINSFLPLLHRPTFDRGVEEKFHLTDNSFGGVLLLVCALGARFSDDPRVIPDVKNGISSAGMQWYSQVHVMKAPAVRKATLYDLQLYPLSVIYQQAACAVQSMWVDITVGLRMAQDLGAHRRGPSTSPNSERELWKRVFWITLYLSRVISGFKGRPTTMNDEDIDVDYPIDCDDDCWESSDPSQNFIQAQGKPSHMSSFLLLLELSSIHVHAMRTIYPVKRPKWASFIKRSEQDAIAELDSAMNEWLSSIPLHLRWDSNRPDSIFHRQSIHLYSVYYQLQIYIHKPFIPTPNSLSWMSSPSLTICARAARSCLQVAKSIYDPSRWHAFPFIHVPIYTAGIILILNCWTTGVDHTRDLEGTQACLDIIESSTNRWKGGDGLWYTGPPNVKPQKILSDYDRYMLNELSLAQRQHHAKPHKPDCHPSQSPIPTYTNAEVLHGVHHQHVLDQSSLPITRFEDDFPFNAYLPPNAPSHLVPINFYDLLPNRTSDHGPTSSSSMWHPQPPLNAQDSWDAFMNSLAHEGSS